MGKQNTVKGNKAVACLIAAFISVIVALYSWHSISDTTLEIETCRPNSQISIQNCSMTQTNKLNVIVQRCEFKNTSKYPITIGYKPGKYYQKFWSYDTGGLVLDRGKLIADAPEMLNPRAIARVRIAYHPDAKRVIVCPVDPTKTKERISLN